MIPLAEVAAHFRRAAAALPPALEAEVLVLMSGAAKDAREFIGHELAGWAPLAPSTIAEKRALGYFGQVSATDPLLRTGTLRDSISAGVMPITFGMELGAIIGVVGSTDPVSIDQELGTSRIPPRPFLAPALLAATPAIQEALGKLLVRACTPGERL